MVLRKIVRVMMFVCAMVLLAAYRHPRHLPTFHKSPASATLPTATDKGRNSNQWTDKRA